jgi:cellulose synthase/poly-beta-1,6-N-acetylglucosamine synthase-like glycosyltransferase
MLLVAIWILYPAVIAAMASFFGRRHVVSIGTRPRVSVIIATRDSDDDIRARVADVLRTTYPLELIEIVVGIDAQSRRDAAVAFDESRVAVRAVLGEPPGGKAATLNAAVREATGDVFVFTDTAQRFAPNAIDELVTSLEDPRFGAVSGALDIPAGSNGRALHEWYWVYERALRAREARVHSAVGVTGAIYALRRSAWAPLPPGLILDDLYVPMRIVLRGLRVGFNPNAVAVDSRRFAAGQEYVRKVRTLTGVLQLCAWLPGVLVPFRNPIWLQFVSHKLMRMITPYLLVLLAIALTASFVGFIDRLLPGGAWLSIGAFAAVALIAPWVSPKLRGAIVSAFALQAAVVHATLNGLRGRWNVW